MTVIQKGKWIEKCKFCKSLIEISVDDLKFVGDYKLYYDADNEIGFNCPVCKNTNVLKKSRVTQNIKNIIRKRYDWDHY